MNFMLQKMRSINRVLYEIVDVIQFVINYHCCYVIACSSLMQIDLRLLISIEKNEKLDFILKNEIFLSLNSATSTSTRNIRRDFARNTRSQRDIIQRVFSLSSCVYIFDNKNISTVIIVNEEIMTKSAIELLNMNNQIEIEHSEKLKHEKTIMKHNRRDQLTFSLRSSVFSSMFFFRYRVVVQTKARLTLNVVKKNIETIVVLKLESF